MRPIAHSFERLSSPESMTGAFWRAVRGRRLMPIGATWLLQRQARLARLREELLTQRWQAPAHRLLFLREPKPRVITVASFEERVVHHALCGVLGPLWERSFTRDTFACLTGRGTHRALLQHQKLMTRHRFLMQLDIRKYFPSIPHERLLEVLLARFPGERLRWLFRAILAGHDLVWQRADVQAHLCDAQYQPSPGKGLPIGLLTSQVWGNAYLSGLDHFIKRELKATGYVRYMDDLTLFANDRATLRRFEQESGQWLQEERGLALRGERTRLLPCTATVDYLGHRVSRSVVVPDERMVWRLEQRLSDWQRTPPSEEHMARSLASVRGLWGNLWAPGANQGS